MLEDERAACIDETRRGRKDPRELRDVGIGRIEQNEPKRAFELLERTLDPRRDDAHTLLGAERAGVVADRRERIASALDEHRLARATRKRLEGERAGAGIEIEHARRAVEEAVRREHREERLADPIRRRARRLPARRAERTGAPYS